MSQSDKKDLLANFKPPWLFVIGFFELICILRPESGWSKSPIQVLSDQNLELKCW